MKLFKFGSIALLTMSLLGLTACTDKIDDSLDEGDKDESADVTVVNAIDDTISFYSKIDTIHRDVLDEDQYRFDILPLQAENYEFEWYDHNDGEGKFGIKEANSQVRTATSRVELKENREYWAIAWTDDSRYRLSVFEKKSPILTTNYRVRLFTDVDADIFIDQEETASFTTEQGVVSQSVSFSDCENGLQVGDNIVDICNNSTEGGNYLVIMNDGEFRIWAEL